VTPRTYKRADGSTLVEIEPHVFVELQHAVRCGLISLTAEETSEIGEAGKKVKPRAAGTAQDRSEIQ
jgi:hypothetical protein